MLRSKFGLIRLFNMSMYSFLTGICIFLTFSFICLAHKRECPPPEALYPCKCMTPHDPTILCVNLTRMETINEIFSQSADFRFRYFVLENSTLMFLPAYSLISKLFYGLLIKNTKLIGLFDSVPSSSNTIAAFSLQNVAIQRGIKWEYFQKLRKLVNMQFIDTKIKALGQDFTKNVNPGLTHLFLQRTRTAKLDKDVFVNLKSIYSINIDSNKIKELRRDMFAKPCNIKSLSFVDNLIESLPNDMFTDMPFLRSVGMQKNNLKQLLEDVFSPVYNNLAVLNVDKNPITCDCKIAWLTTRPISKVLGFCSDKSPVRKLVPINTLVEKDFNYCKD